MSSSPEKLKLSQYRAGERVSVLLPLPFHKTFTYHVQKELVLSDGDFVKVGFGKKEIIGVVWGISNEDIPEAKIRNVRECINYPPLPYESRVFIDWVSSYTMQPKGLILKMSMSIRSVFTPQKKVSFFKLCSILPEFKQTKARTRVISFLAEGTPKSMQEILKGASVSQQTVKVLLENGVLERSLKSTDVPRISESFSYRTVQFSREQQFAVRQLVNAIKSAEFRVNLLDGVPGSGKTEVYFEAILEVLLENKQILVLLPEISLSTQWLNRFNERFGFVPGVWHSDLSTAERRETWRQIINGTIKVVVGARSALFLPYSNLGLIIVDEEHDSGFKQEEGVIYNARDMAIVRAQFGNFTVILASATPSLETIVNTKTERYGLLTLPNRHGGSILPKIEAIDMCQSPPPKGKWLSPKLVEKMRKVIERGEQALLFLNRRGYAPLTLCRGCGFRFKCPSCTSWLVEHRSHLRLQCHQCGFKLKTPSVCPDCKEEGSLTACGPGVERLAEEVRTLLPENRIIIASSDNIDSPKAAEKLVTGVEQREIDIIVGTQLVAKGYHFPYLTLVGVVDADLSLQGGDLRASERTFQLLYQVAGRAGRENRPGTVILQTYMNTHPVISTLVSGDRSAFLRTEIEARKYAGLPPFGRLVALIVTGKLEYEVNKVALKISRVAPNYPGVEIFGPAPAIFPLLRGRHRRRFLIKAKKGIFIQPIIQDWLSQLKLPHSIRIHIDVDPMSFM